MQDAGSTKSRALQLHELNYVGGVVPEDFLLEVLLHLELASDPVDLGVGGGQRRPGHADGLRGFGGWVAVGGHNT